MLLDCVHETSLKRDINEKITRIFESWLKRETENILFKYNTFLWKCVQLSHNCNENMVKGNRTLACNICFLRVVCHFPQELSYGALAGEVNARVFCPLVFGDHFQCYGVWRRLLGVGNWIWKIDVYGPYQRNYSEIKVLLLINCII